MKAKQKKRILLLAALLAGAVFLGGCGAPEEDDSADQAPESSYAETSAAPEGETPGEESTQDSEKEEEASAPPEAEKEAQEKAPSAQKPQEKPAPPQKQEKPSIPNQPQKPENSKAEYTCTISISCATILNNLDALDAGKQDLVPEDGWILAPMQVSFSEGESVFDVLQRICRAQKIHMEFEDTPLYDSAYIEGIGNLYEFDCGPLSGWEYAVNDWFPNYGCSRYTLKDGDVIAWLYTCDLGADIGAPVGNKGA